MTNESLREVLATVEKLLISEKQGIIAPLMGRFSSNGKFKPQPDIEAEVAADEEAWRWENYVNLKSYISMDLIQKAARELSQLIEQLDTSIELDSFRLSMSIIEGYEGKNPKTGEPIVLPEKKVVIGEFLNMA